MSDISQITMPDGTTYDIKDSVARSATSINMENGTGTDAVKQTSASSASGAYAFAEGDSTAAGAAGAHAEGRLTEARGQYSHAQNLGTLASSKSQTVLGEYNDQDPSGTYNTRGKYVVIIGNGSSSYITSNALTVDWDGEVQLALDTAAASGVDHDLYAALVSLGWDSDVIK